MVDAVELKKEKNGFNRIVLEAASGNDINELIDALTIYRHLIDTPDPSDCVKRTPMHQAATQGNVLAIETLVRFGSQAIDALDNVGCTPMHFAAWFGHQQSIEALVRLGSTAIDIQNKCGLTPLWYAARFNPKCTQLLRVLGANVIETAGLPKTAQERLLESIDEEEAVGVRYRIYFGYILLQRLLFELEKPASLKAVRRTPPHRVRKKAKFRWISL